MKNKKCFQALLFLLIFLSTTITIDALSNPSATNSSLVNATQSIGDQATPPKAGGGSADGNAVLQDTSSVSICGVKINKSNPNIRNIQIDKYGKPSIKLKSSSLSDLQAIFGDKNGQIVYNSLESGKVYSSGYVLAYPSLCGVKIEVVSYDVITSKFEKVDAKIEVVDLWNQNPNTKENVSVGKNLDSAVCSTNGTPFTQQNSNTNLYASSSNKSSVISSDKLTHTYSTKAQNYRKPYTFGCAGKYKVTFVEHYANGETKTKVEYVEVGLDTFIDEIDLESQSNLIINR